VIGFDWPWLVLCAPLPWLLRRLLPAARSTPENAVRVPFFDEIRSLATPATALTGRRSLESWLMWIAWLALVLAAAKPEYVADAIETPVSGRDLVLAIDISGSMERPDFTVNRQKVSRLSVVKYVASEFVKRREGDRLGLVLFGARAYLQTPLTFDRDTIVAMLGEAEIGLAGKQTAIGDAIGLSVKRMRQAEQTERVLILLTDGANTTGAMAPRRAAQLAAHDGLRIYTIGIGADQVHNTIFGTLELQASADLDERTLTDIAETTGGKYFRASDTESLQRIYRELDRLEPLEFDDQVFRPTRSLYYWPLALALCLSVWLALRRIRWRQRFADDPNGAVT
jgi:Ca-activated chloride channel family protein